MAVISIVQPSAGDSISADHVKALARTLQALGLTDDNDADPILARAMPYPVPVKLGDATVATKAVSGTSYTVPASTMFIVTMLQTQTNNITVTVSGGSAKTISTGGAQKNIARVHIPLAAGDQISCGASCRAAGFLVTSISDVTTFFKETTNADPYTVPASKLAILTHVGLGGSAAAGSGVVFNLNGVNAWETRGPSGDNTAFSDTLDFRQTIPAKAGETLGSNTATAMIVAGYLLQ